MALFAIGDLHLCYNNPEKSMDVFGDVWKHHEEYHVEKVIYAHCHGEERYHDSIEGNFHGVEYHLASGDFLRWVPMKVME